MHLNENLSAMRESYVFAWAAEEAANYRRAHPNARLLALGIGDVTGPLPAPVADALVLAAKEQSRAESFRGYAPAAGYPFLRQALAADYARRGVALAPEELFVTHGAKDTLAALMRLFPQGARMALPDPGYPVYAELCALSGGVPLLCPAAEGFPAPPAEGFDLAFLCSPMNPTGAAATKEQLAAWVRAARACGGLLLFDAAYEAYVRTAGVPRSIYEVEGARECAAELGSLSKTAGFTGLRCGHLALPDELRADGKPLSALWQKLLAVCDNGVAYPAQRAAEAAYTCGGRLAARALADGYLANARALCAALPTGSAAPGGDSPYVWVRCGGDSRAFFQRLLEAEGILCTPGAGFGAGGEGFIRLSGFCAPDEARQAARRIRNSALFFP